MGALLHGEFVPLPLARIGDEAAHFGVNGLNCGQDGLWVMRVGLGKDWQSSQDCRS